MLFTSCYRNAGDLDRDKSLLVKISNSCPKEFNDCIRLEKAVPDWGLMVAPHRAGEISDQAFEDRYVTQLDKYKENIIAVIANMVKDHKDIYFLCWEKPNEFCHRHIFAKYVNGLLGKDVVTEYVPKPVVGTAKALF
jgi:hypothetical protein